VTEDSSGNLPHAFRVCDRVDLDDLALDYSEPHHGKWSSTDCDNNPGCAVHQCR
jgi:hypothetical protein